MSLGLGLGLGRRRGLSGGRVLWTPAQLPGIVGWWTARDAASIVYGIGSAVSSWSNKSVGAVAGNFNQGTAARQPVFDANGIAAGKPGLTFDGVDDAMDGSVFRNPTTTLSGCASVLTFPSTPPATRPFFARGNVDGGTGQWSLRRTTANACEIRTNSFSAPSVSSAVATPSIWYASVNTAGPLRELSKDGATPSTNTTTPTGTGNHNYRLGWGGSNSCPVVVGELVVFEMALSVSDRQKLEGYLAHTWGLQANLPVGHPYGTLPP